MPNYVDISATEKENVKNYLQRFSNTLLTSSDSRYDSSVRELYSLGHGLMQSNSGHAVALTRELIRAVIDGKLDDCCWISRGRTAAARGYSDFATIKGTDLLSGKSKAVVNSTNTPHYVDSQMVEGMKDAAAKLQQVRANNYGYVGHTQYFRQWASKNSVQLMRALVDPGQGGSQDVSVFHGLDWNAMYITESALPAKFKKITPMLAFYAKAVVTMTGGTY